MKLQLNDKTNAVELAIKLHQNQKDLVGESYIQHLAAVNHNAMSIFTKLMKNKSLSLVTDLQILQGDFFFKDDFALIYLHELIKNTSWLHDSLEDCSDKINYEYIVDMFDDVTAMTIQKLTKDSTKKCEDNFILNYYLNMLDFDKLSEYIGVDTRIHAKDISDVDYQKALISTIAAIIIKMADLSHNLQYKRLLKHKDFKKFEKQSNKEVSNLKVDFTIKNFANMIEKEIQDVELDEDDERIVQFLSSKLGKRHYVRLDNYSRQLDVLRFAFNILTQNKENIFNKYDLNFIRNNYQYVLNDKAQKASDFHHMFQHEINVSFARKFVADVKSLTLKINL
jgi:hypothetical protein